MELDTFLLIICTFAFLVVSVALSAKFIMEAYLEYIQVKEGIRVMTMKDQKALLEEIMNEDEEDL